MDSIEHLDSDGYDPLADPDVYVLVRQGRVEAVLSDADLMGLARVVKTAADQEKRRAARRPVVGLAAAFDLGMNNPSGPYVDVVELNLKFDAVLDRLWERLGLGAMRGRLRGLVQPPRRPDQDGGGSSCH